jgi:hypothetical protein
MGKSKLIIAENDLLWLAFCSFVTGLYWGWLLTVWKLTGST